jgi:uncharacterized delta-60 repeat protein
MKLPIYIYDLHFNLQWAITFFLLVPFAANAQTVDSFNPQPSGVVYRAMVQNDNKVVFTGQFTNVSNHSIIGIARTDSLGSLDTNFTSPFSGGSIFALGVNTNNNIFAGGSVNGLSSVVTKIGDYSFSKLNMVQNTSGGAYNINFQQDGKLLISGDFAIQATSYSGPIWTNMIRLNPNGTVDQTFSNFCNQLSAFYEVYQTTVLPNGQIIAAGAFTTIGNKPHTNIVRLNVNGMVDTNFNASANATVLTSALQADGKIIIGGSFTNVDGVQCNRIARLNPDGSLDSNFLVSASGSINALSIQADGKILLCGGFTNVNATTALYLARLNADGSLDNTFPLSADYNAYFLQLQTDGNILVCGGFTNLNSVRRKYFGRIINNEFATNLLTFDGTNAFWLRGGASPEVSWTTFDASTNGNSFKSFGLGLRANSGWKYSVQGLPTNATIRARGFISSMFYEASVGQPAITTEPWNFSTRSANAGQPISFSVTAIGSTPLFYQWCKNGIPLNNAANISGIGTPTLTLTNVFAADSGNYSIVVSNSFGSITSLVVNLIVKDPYISAQPTNLTVNLGSNAVFSVVSTGTPPLNFQWQINGVSFTGANQNSLTITNTSITNVGNPIDVVVSNATGVVTSSIAYLTVNATYSDNTTLFDYADSSEPGSLAQQTDGKILIGGYLCIPGYNYNDALARFDNDGTLDRIFYSGGGLVSPNSLRIYAIQTNGLILAGIPYIGIRRYNTNGNIDNSFHAPNAGGSTMVLQGDGKIIIGGSFNAVNGFATTNIARLNIDGTVDTSFIAASGDGQNLALQGDGKLLVTSGSLSQIVRLNTDGTIDNTFKSISPYYFYLVTAIAVQADGKSLVAGILYNNMGQIVDQLSRLNSDGSLDLSFRPNITPFLYSSINSISLQANGKIVLAGNFTAIGGQNRLYIGRINMDGSIDFNFDPQINSTRVGSGNIYCSAVQFDGKILIGGLFTGIQNQNANWFGRLIDMASQPTNQVFFDGTNVCLFQSGGVPQFWKTTFEYTLDGINFTGFGNGQYVGNYWKSPAIAAPATASIRIRGFETGGQNNGSSWYFETNIPAISQSPPVILSSSASFQSVSNLFGFTYSGSAGQAIVIESSTNLLNWTAVNTNVGSGPFVFTDYSTNEPACFYRARLQ